MVILKHVPFRISNIHEWRDYVLMEKFIVNGFLKWMDYNLKKSIVNGIKFKSLK